MPHRPASRHARRAAGLLAVATAALLAGPGRATADVLPVSVPITIDGDMADWAPVFTNPRNSAWDGDGHSVACAYSSDRDCDVDDPQADLARFAWTWDANGVSFYVERFANSAPWVYVQVYFDVNYNGLVEDGAPVLTFRWNSNGTTLDYARESYDAQAPGGDPPQDAQGYADGYDMPGRLTGSSGLTTRASAPDGLSLEAFVPWAQLLVPPNSPMRFHVATSTSVNVPSNTADNMGGAGGAAGDTGYRDLSFGPPRELSAGPSQTLDIPHRACNLGNIPARFDIRGTSLQGWDIDYWIDLEPDGWPDVYLGHDEDGDGNMSRSRDDLTPEGDSNGDGKLDIGILAAGQCVDIVLRQTYASNTNDTMERIDLAAIQGEAPAERVDIVDVVRVGKITMRQDEERVAVAGDRACFPHLLKNNTGTAERVDLALTSTRGWIYQFQTGAGVPIGDVNGNGMPDLQVTAGEEVPFQACVDVPAAALVGQVDIATVRAIVSGNTRDTLVDTATVGQPLSVEPDHLLSNGDPRYGAPGGSIYFPHVLINAQGRSDSFTLATSSSAGWPVTLLSDPDGDGRPFDSQRLPGSTGSVAPNGGRFHFIARVDVPAGSATGSTTRVTITAQSSSAPVISDSAEDDAFAAIVRVYEDSSHLVNIVQTPPCARIWAQANGLPASTPDFRLVWRNASGTAVRVTPIQTDIRGACEDDLQLAPGDGGAGWSVDIQELVGGNWVSLDVARWDVVDGAAVTSLGTLLPSYHLSGTTLTATAALVNSSPTVARPGLDMRWLVLTPDRFDYLRPDGTFAPYTGTQWTRIDAPLNLPAGGTLGRALSVGSVDYPRGGTYLVETWLSSTCGGMALARATTFLVVDDEDGDGVLHADEVDAGTDPADGDSDDDGVGDLQDGLGDSDGDGLVDALDCDSDNDLLFDGTETGAWTPHPHTDVGAGCFRPDSWPGDTTNPDDADTDGGGVPDGAEDLDRDGRRDAGETDPNNPADDSTADSDSDGLLDVVETVIGSDPSDADTDDDGRLDGDEPLADADGDGTHDALECDSDGDGLGDGLEVGLVTAGPATDLAAGCFVADADPATSTNPFMADTDLGGVDDGVEDADRNGRRDAGEGDPNDPADDDADGDGLGASAEAAAGTSPFDADSDDDGLGDGVEGTADADGDGIAEAMECDSDGDGLPDGLERGVSAPGPDTDVTAGCFRADADPASQTDPLDADTDGGGVSDGAEDADRDGAVGAAETDPSIAADDDGDGDGLPNLAEDAIGTSRSDRDSDDDGAIDSAEATDASGDGTIDALQCDADGDGLPDGLERGVSVPDADTDVAAGCFRADADPATTTDPASADTDGGGLPDGAEDADADGSVGAGETDPNVAADDSTVLDADGDGLSDAAEAALGTSPTDRDTDDDGVPDGAEGAGDADGDTIVDALACDADGDALPDGLELGLVAPDAGTDLGAGCFRADADPATTTDPRAADSDGGGVPDGAEDADGNGAWTSGERSPLVAADDACSTAVPPEASGLMLVKSAGGVTLTWDAMADPCTTSVAWTSESLPALARGASGLVAPTWEDTTSAGIPLRFYLVSGESPISGAGPTGL